MPKSTHPTNNKNPQPLQSPPMASLDLNLLPQYLKFFLTINQYRTIDQAKTLIKLISEQKNENIIQEAVKMICYLYERAGHEGKVCTLQFIKQLMDIGKLVIFQVLQKNLVGSLKKVIQYRKSVKTIMRGSSYFLSQISKNEKEDQVADLVRLSNTYCRMSHEILYVWGNKYFPISEFNNLYEKVKNDCTFPEFPGDFKFYRQSKICLMMKSVKIMSINDYLESRNVKQNINIQVESKHQQIYDRSNQNTKKHQNQSLKQAKQNPKQVSKVNIVQLKKESTNVLQKESNAKGSQPKAKQTEIDSQLVFDTFKKNEDSLAKRESKIVSKPSKSSKKPTTNFIYRESPIEDPEDLTKQIQSISEIKTKSKSRIDIPLGIIVQRSAEQSKQQVKIKAMNELSQQKISKQSETLKVQINENDSQISTQRIAYSVVSSNEAIEQKQNSNAQKMKSKPIESESKTIIKGKTFDIKTKQYETNANEQTKIVQKVQKKPIKLLETKQKQEVKMIQIQKQTGNYQTPSNQKIQNRPENYAIKSTKSPITKSKQQNRDQKCEVLPHQQVQQKQEEQARKQKLQNNSNRSKQRNNPLQQSPQNQQQAYTNDPLQSLSLSLSQSQEQNSVSKSKKQKGFKKRRQSLSNLFDSENIITESLHLQNKHQTINTKSRELQFFSSFSIKQLCQSQKIQPIKQQKNRNLRKFREVAITIIPDIRSSSRIKNQLQIKNMEQLNSNIANQMENLQSKIINTNQNMEQIKKVFFQNQKNILSNTLQVHPTLSNQNSVLNSPFEKLSTTSKIITNKSNSSKKSSLSQSKNLQESYENGTMLHLMARRKSFLL